MSSLNAKLGILAAGLILSGCMQATTFEATSQTNFKPRDKELLAKVSYVKTPVAEPFRRAIVVPTIITFTSSRTAARRSATVLPLARKRWRGPASPRSAA